MANIPSHIGPAEPVRPDGFRKISLSREQFEMRLGTIETCRQIIASQAYHIDPLTASAIQIANQVESNMTVMVQMCDLMKETGVTVAYNDEYVQGHIPMPPFINHNLTMLNFDNNR